jgi:hypothetical protein
MTEAQTWTIAIALIVILLGFGGAVLWVLHSTLATRADSMRQAWETWQHGARTRATTAEIQRINLETRLAAIETRITLLTPTISTMESMKESADDVDLGNSSPR